MRRRQLIVAFAAAGLIITAVLFVYLEITDYKTMHPTLLGASLVLCPPALLSVTFFDLQPHTPEIAIGWAVIGLINSALYGGIGVGVSRCLWKSDSPRK